MSDLYWLTDEQMACLRPYFPKRNGRPRVDDRRVLSGIVFVQRIGSAGAQHMRERMPGWWATIARMANANSISPICCRHPDQGSDRRDQGALDMRASPSATQGRTRPGPLRGPVLGRAPPPRLDDDDGLCLPAKPPDRSGGTEKKSLRPTAAPQPASSAPSHS